MYIYGPHGESISQNWTNSALELIQVHRRYFFIRPVSESVLASFLERLNNFYSNLTFTHERSREEINFLDLTFKINQGEVIIDLYCKSRDCHQYLHYESCHSSHTKYSIIFTQTLTMRRICSKKSDLVANVKKLKVRIVSIKEAI